MTIPEALDLVGAEVARAESKFAPFNSAHEGYVVILEELDELWDEVKLNGQLRDRARMRQEAVQVAAMAVRFLLNVVEHPTVDAVARTDGVVAGVPRATSA